MTDLDALDALHAAAKATTVGERGFHPLSSVSEMEFRDALEDAYPALSAELRELRETKDLWDLALKEHQQVKAENEELRHLVREVYGHVNMMAKAITDDKLKWVCTDWLEAADRWLEEPAVTGKRPVNANVILDDGVKP